MKLLTWDNEAFGKFNFLAEITKSELSLFREIYNCNDLIAATWDGEQYYFFVDTKAKVLTPMNSLAFAFGPCYNGSPPYGKEVKVKFDPTDYRLILKTEYEARANLDTAYEKERFRRLLKRSNTDNFPLARAYSFKFKEIIQ